MSIPDNYDRTAATISQELSNKVSFFNIKDSITGAITDCAAVMKNAITIFDIPWAPCLAHIIHNSIKKMLDDCEQFNVAMKHANIIADDFRFKQYLGAHSKHKKNVQTFNDIRWLTRAKTCKDIVEFYSRMKHFETEINKIISDKNLVNSQKINDYVCPITNSDYNICLTLNPVLQKLKMLIYKLEKRTHDGYFNALKFVYKCSQAIKANLISNGLSDLYFKFENYLLDKIKKYTKLAELMGTGALLNPNLDIEDLIDNNSPFYFIVEIGKNYINNKLKQSNELSSTVETIHKKGERKRKENLNEYQLWSTIV